jgi:preprotein translocase subunit YajC
LPLVGLGYLLFIRPQSIAQKKQKETIGGAKTGDKVVMTNGIHGVIANVKDGTFIVKIADNVKIEVEKIAVDKVTRAAAEPAKIA